MSRMSELDAEMQRLSLLDDAVRNYLSHLAAVEAGSKQDVYLADFWRGEMESLCDGEPFGYTENFQTIGPGDE